MKDMINERLILLAKSQECMADVSDRIEQWESSQAILEKRAFEAMNVSDKILNLSNEGTKLVDELRRYYDQERLDADQSDIVATVLLNELKCKLDNILENANEASEISHSLEEEVAMQREIGEGMKSSLWQISGSIDAAEACAEFMLAEL